MRKGEKFDPFGAMEINQQSFSRKGRKMGLEEDGVAQRPRCSGWWVE